MDHNRHWVGTWAAAPAPSEAGVGLNNHTLRMNPRVSIGGDTARVRAFGPTTDLHEEGALVQLDFPPEAVRAWPASRSADRDQGGPA